ncbi:MAG: hypothetical protein PUP91_35545 [Rhizonema sp. PD37]|nr:hypothetical protein [Rhizonema sp. PD37]
MTSIISSNFTAILARAAVAYKEPRQERPSADMVVDALLYAEKATKQQRLEYPFPSLLGKWRLCFVTGTRKVKKRGGIVLGKGFYVPKFARAHILFSPSTQALDSTPTQGEIGNQVQLGSVSLKLLGPAQYLGKKNLLAFDFTNMQISLFGRVIYTGQIRGGKQELDFENKPIGKLPFFAFFLVTEDFIAARGRGGGLALWIREN